MSPLTTALVLAALVVVAGVFGRSYVVGRRVRARLRPAGPDRRGHTTSLGPGSWTGEQLTAAAVAASLGLTGLVSLVGPIGLVLAAVMGPTVPLILRHRQRVEGRRLRRRQLPAALDRLATALRGGSSVPTALAEAGAMTPPPIGPELVGLGRRANAGQAVADVLDGWSARHDDAGTRLAATALTLATAVGGAPGQAVDGVAATLRERVDLADERRALASQARLSALVLAAAPVGFAALLGVADGRTATFLLRTPTGWACLVVGLGLDATGAWWMARLTRGTEP